MKYAILLFDTEINLGISSQPMRYFNFHTLYYDNGDDALFEYIYPPEEYEHYPMKLIQGETDEDLAWESAKAIEEMNSPQEQGQVLD